MEFGFIGATYRNRSIAADGERCINLYPERIESGKSSGKAQYYLRAVPGKTTLCTLPGVNLGLFEADGRLFAISGCALYEIDSTGAYRKLADLPNATAPVSVADNGKEVLIVFSGYAWLMAYDGTVRAVNPNERLGQCASVDGYFLGLVEDSRKFVVSAIMDGTTWDGLDFALKEGNGDKLVSLFVDHREIWLLGEKHAEVWYNSGNADFPFQRIQGAALEQGCAARHSVARLDNSIVWLGSSERGAGVVWRANGYTPQRISNHGVESFWATYPRIDDAIGWSYEESGHQLYVLHFPTAEPNPVVVAGMNTTPTYRGATWVYDASTQMWHERAYWDAASGVWQADRGRWHAFAFCKHYVADYASGAVYELSSDAHDDAGDPLRWLRSAPHVCADLDWVFPRRLQVLLQAGVGTMAGQGQNPKIYLEVSRDGGFTWGPQIEAAMGKSGEYTWRAIWRRLGRGRNICFRVSGSDPVETALIDGILDVEKGGA